MRLDDSCIAAAEPPDHADVEDFLAQVKQDVIHLSGTNFYFVDFNLRRTSDWKEDRTLHEWLIRHRNSRVANMRGVGGWIRSSLIGEAEGERRDDQ